MQKLHAFLSSVTFICFIVFSVMKMIRAKKETLSFRSFLIVSTKSVVKKNLVFWATVRPVHTAIRECQNEMVVSLSGRAWMQPNAIKIYSDMFVAWFHKIPKRNEFISTQSMDLYVRRNAAKWKMQKIATELIQVVDNINLFTIKAHSQFMKYAQMHASKKRRKQKILIENK